MNETGRPPLLDSVLLDAGVSLFHVSRRLGHASIAITSDTYGHLMKDFQKDIAEKFAKIMSGAS